jgi:hypothetical protein
VRADDGERVVSEFALAVADEGQDGLADALRIAVDFVGDDQRGGLAAGGFEGRGAEQRKMRRRCASWSATSGDRE